ncbi:MAG: hypothetical protein IH836_10630 [Proteobacteria bacterium]|nr:hypothetical protein [Pseudomonadota bacterium]
MPSSTNLKEVITKCHNVLDEIFLIHQEAVLLGKFDEAKQILDCYKVLHDLHKDFEDQHLIPMFDELGNQGQWQASLYTQEHQKINELMDNTENNLRQLSESQLDDRNLRRNIIAFLDREKTFKGYCEHHQEREEAGLLPSLDAQTDTEWRAKIIWPFVKEWEQCMERNMKIIKNLKIVNESSET